MLELNLVSPNLAKEQLNQVAKSFSVDRALRLQLKQECCFRRACRACERGEWELIELNALPLSLLVDSLGRTLLLRAIDQQDDRIVAGLVDRSVGITTKDRYNKTILDYLAFQAGGDRSNFYAELIRKKLKTRFTSNSLVNILEEEEKSALEYTRICNFLRNISNSSAPDEGIKMLKMKVNKIYSLFEAPLPIMVEYQKAIHYFEEKRNLHLSQTQESFRS